jgi:hypothetical protein
MTTRLFSRAVQYETRMRIVALLVRAAVSNPSILKHLALVPKETSWAG